MSESARLGLPYLQAGQVQKEVTHNEALRLLDSVAAAAVDGVGGNAPPASPASGACYIVGTAPTGDWAGRANALASYAAGGWRFVAAVDGLTALIKSSGLIAVYRSGSWEAGILRGDQLILGGNQVVVGRLAAVTDPSGGTTIDSEARAAIASILARLREHGLIAP